MDIDIFRFLYDKEIFCITVQFLDGEDYKFLQEINLKKDKSNLDHKDLKKIGLDWINNNVEVVSNLEKEVAPEVPVREQRIKSKLNKVLIYILILSILQLSSTIFSVLYAKNQKAYLQDYYKNLQEIKMINKSQ
ncbi:hypothetical protein VT96_0202440 [Clostridium sporogenes]|nr:hypothetical protein VT96_0202440 [Clostridium sporogenes]SQB31565.1 Uncharacterised protein [Clostridium sporogenes]